MVDEVITVGLIMVVRDTLGKPLATEAIFKRVCKCVLVPKIILDSVALAFAAAWGGGGGGVS